MKVPFCNGVTQEERKECIRAMMLDYPSEMSEELKDLLRKVYKSKSHVAIIIRKSDIREAGRTNTITGHESAPLFSDHQLG